ncbi:MAG: hypothetical protein ABI266_04540 [Ginsengibacter sp.]
MPLKKNKSQAQIELDEFRKTGIAYFSEADMEMDCSEFNSSVGDREICVKDHLLANEKFISPKQPC